MNIRSRAGFAKLNTRERVIASVVLSILYDLESIDPQMVDDLRSSIMDAIESKVIKLAKLFY